VAAGWLSDLIQYDSRHASAVSLVFGNTACVNTIDVAKTVKPDGFRIVTLEGDLFEQSGSITGGYYRLRKHASAEGEVRAYSEEKRRLERESESLEKQIRLLNEDLGGLAEKEKQTRTFELERGKVKIDEQLRSHREKRKEAYEKRLAVQEQINRLNVRRARQEALFESMKVEWGNRKLDSVKQKDLEPFVSQSSSSLVQKESETVQAIQQLGPVNLKALEDFEVLRREFDEFRVKVEKIIEEKKAIEDSIAQIDAKRKEVFSRTLKEISRHFQATFKELTGGVAALELEDEDNIDTGLLIKAQPPGKKLLNIDSMSGGEKTLTSFAFLFAIQGHRPSPFYILDEADAALDGVNTKRVVGLLKKHSKDVQFIVISHNDELVRAADQIYGVSMEDGESKVIAIKLPAENT
jgi:chromosome segregation protein